MADVDLFKVILVLIFLGSLGGATRAQKKSWKFFESTTKKTVLRPLSVFSLILLTFMVPTTADADQISIMRKISPYSEGSFKAGLFYDNVDGAVLTSAFNQEQLLGLDENLTADVTYGSKNLSLRVGSTDPDIFESDWSRTLSFGSQKFSPNQSLLRDFRFSNTDTELSFFKTLNKTSGLKIATGYSLLDFNQSEELPLTIMNSTALKDNKVETAYLKASSQYSTIYGETFPTSGSEIITSLEIGNAGSTPYAITSVAAQGYKALNNHIFTRIGFAASFGHSGREEFPFNKNTFVGGAGSVRGYKQNSLGPLSNLKISGDPTAVGGQHALTTTLEIGTLLGEQKKLIAFAFFDAGNTANNLDGLDFGSLKKTRGLGLRWKPPLGSLEISFAEAIHPTNQALTEKLQITLGRVF